MTALKVAAHAGALSLLLFAVVRCSDSSEPGGAHEPEAGAGGRASGGRASTGGRAGAPTGSGGETTGSGGVDSDASTGDGGSGGRDAGSGDAGISRCQREVFVTALHSAFPDPPAATAAADVDGDGDTDVLVLRRAGGAEQFRSWVRVVLNRGDGTFEPGERFDVESGGSVIAAGDLDGDERPDVIVGHGAADGVPDTVGAVSVLLNDGQGAFGKSVGYPAGTAHRSLTLGDIDGDGDADLVVTNHGSAELRILRNDGQGAFAAPVVLAVGPSPEGAAVADLDGDGHVDLAVTDAAAAARVLLGQDGGGFAAPVAYGGAPDANLAGRHDGIAAADFTGDGKPDLLVRRNARLLVGQGNGTFAAPVTLAAAPGGDGFAADFDGNGKLDVALASAEGVSIRLGNGDGTFSPRADRAYAVSTALPPLTADFDGDGDLDVAAADRVAVEESPDPAFPDAGRQDIVVSGTVAVIRNAGDGVFDGETNYVVPASEPPATVAAADLDGDGRTDLATTVKAGPSANGSVAYALNAGGGVMAAPVLLPSGGVNPASVTAGADLNGDGRPDLVVVNAGADGIESTAGVILSGPNGTFLPVKVASGVPGVSRAFVGRFDADERPDILVSGATDSYVLAGQADGNFAAPARIDVPSVITVTDFDGDGDTDLVATLDTWAVEVRINQGDGTYGPSIPLAVFWRPNWRTFAVTAADFDGNGRPDVLITSGQADVLTDPDSTGTIYQAAQVAVFYSLWDGKFDEARVTTPTFPRNSRPTTLGTGDFDGDGHLDVVVGSGASPGSGIAPSVFVLVNRGNGTFFEPVPWGSRNGTGALLTTRLNDDDADDLALASGRAIGVFLSRACDE